MSDLNYRGLLDLARREADEIFAASWPVNARYQLMPVRDRLVVQKFLQRICPIDIPEARIDVPPEG